MLPLHPRRRSPPRTLAAQPERLAGAELNLLSIALRKSCGRAIVRERLLVELITQVDGFIDGTKSKISATA